MKHYKIHSVEKNCFSKGVERSSYPLMPRDYVGQSLEKGCAHELLVYCSLYLGKPAFFTVPYLLGRPVLSARL